MATAADIPPELFKSILSFVCDYTDASLDSMQSQVLSNRREIINDIAACSLTCVYWAHICRKPIFRMVRIKNYEDMCAFRSLVLNTPKRFTPISDYVRSATLVQQVQDQPWLHLYRLRPSLFSVITHAHIRFHVVDSHWQFGTHDKAVAKLTPQGPTTSTHRRLLGGLPRDLPLSCLQCADLTIDNPHFQTLADITSLLRKFLCPSDQGLHVRCILSNVIWDPASRTHLAGALLTMDMLEISRSHSFMATVKGIVYAAETAWLTCAAILLQLRAGTPPTSRHENGVILQLLPSAQRVILDIGTLLCQGQTMSTSFVIHNHFMRNPGTKHADSSDYLHRVCDLEIQGGKNMLPIVSLQLYTSLVVEDLADGDGTKAVDRICAICAFIDPSGNEYDPAESPSNKMRPIIAYPWEEIVRICTLQNGFVRLQLEFRHRDDLVKLMEAHLSTFAQLSGRIGLFYGVGQYGPMHAADPETLVELSSEDAWDDYISSF